MRRVWFLVIPMLAMMVAVMLPVGRADRLAPDPEAPWVVTHAERFLPPDWGLAVIQSVSPKGSWAYGVDETNVDQETCSWDLSTPDWKRTCPELEPGEAISQRFSGFAWLPTDDAFVTTTYMLTDGMRYVERLVQIELAAGKVTELYRPEPGTYIPQLAVSPDGGQVAFVQIAADGPITIQGLDIDGGEPETIMTASEMVTLSDADDLHWTAADQIVFYSGPYASDTQGYFRINSDGSGLARFMAVTPGESRTRIHDVTADGRYMIAEGVTETEACGRNFAVAKSYVVDLERDEIAQVVCNVYQADMPGARGANLFVTTRAVVTSEPAFLPDGSILVLVEQRSGDDAATGLAVLDARTGQLRIVSNDLPSEAGLWGVSSALDDGSVRVWVGGHWRDVITLAPRAG